MKLKWGATTDVGMVRQQNEDAYLAEENLYIVADGMGGHNAGEVASALAVTTVKAGSKSGIHTMEQFRELVQQANTAIYTASLDDSTQSGMGTTLTALAVVPGEEPRVLVANVGDSRTYLFRNGALSRLSVDHSYVQELVNEGILTPEEARVHPRRNIVTRAMGIERSVMVDVFTHLVRTGDRIVLCSDGLVDEVPDTDIATVLSQHSDAQETAEALVLVANANGGRDNTTVVVVDILDDISEPVDLPEAENELNFGYHQEYSSMKLGFYLFAEYINMIMSSAIMASMYFGGYDLPFFNEASVAPNIAALIGVGTL